MRRDGLARAGKMYRVPQAGPRQPAVAGPVVQRGVRPQRGARHLDFVFRFALACFQRMRLDGLANWSIDLGEYVEVEEHARACRVSKKFWIRERGDGQSKGDCSDSNECHDRGEPTADPWVLPLRRNRDHSLSLCDR